MNKIYIQNLGMIVTNKCNLNCDHCLRGCKNSKDMSKDVIEATLKQIVAIGNLCLCGGEPTLALETIEYIFKYIMDHKIILDQVSVTINGSNYSKDFLNLLDNISEYITSISNDCLVMFMISNDDYHRKELERLGLISTYLENIQRYANSEYYYGMRELDHNLKLFREGNAEYLNKNITVELKPIDIVLSYCNECNDCNKQRLCNIGPLMTVNTDGIITEDNASLIHEHTIYNYGNVFNDSLEDVALKRGKIVDQQIWEDETDKIIQKYVSYNG